MRQTEPMTLSVFKDLYMLEFLDLPAGRAEADLHRALLLKLKDFLTELGARFLFCWLRIFLSMVTVWEC